MAEAAVADEEHEVLRPGGEEVNSMASPITAEEVRMMASPITSPRERPSPAGGPQEKVVVDPGLLLGMPMLVVEELFFEPEALLNLVRKVWIAKPRSIAEKFAYLRDEEEGETPRHHWLTLFVFDDSYVFQSGFQKIWNDQLAPTGLLRFCELAVSALVAMGFRATWFFVRNIVAMLVHVLVPSIQ